MDRKVMGEKPPEPSLHPEDKRKAYRTPMVCPISYQLLEGGKAVGSLLPATTMDISSTGALVRTSQPLPLAAKYRLNIQIPGAPSALVATAKVVRIEEEEPAQKYMIG